MNKKSDILIFVMLIGLFSVMFPTEAHAVDISAKGLDDMFASFTSSSKALTRLVEFVSYMLGIALVLNSVFKFSQLGSNPQMSPKVPISFFLVGVGLVALTGSLSVVHETMAMGSGPGDILAPSGGGGLKGMTSAGITGVLYFVRLIGYVAFVRGWLLLNQAGQGKDGALGRGLTHLFGGVAAINMQTTAQILANSFGWNVSL